MVTLDLLYDELRAIHHLLADRGPSRLSRADCDRLARILPVVVGAVGSAAFLVRELLEHSSAGLRLVLAGCSSRSLGRLLRRAEGQPVAGFVVQRVGVEAGAKLWQIVKVDSEVSGPVKTARALAPSTRTR